jgi:hypothetical protein
MADAVRWAEEIMKEIDSRWSTRPVKGLTGLAGPVVLFLGLSNVVL